MDKVIEGLLRQIKLLQAVDLESIQGLLDACTFRSLATDEVLIRKGQLNRTVYFLLKGKVQVHLDTPEGPPPAVLGIGESVGEMSVIDHQPASAFVVAQRQRSCWPWTRRSSGPWSSPPTPRPAISWCRSPPAAPHRFGRLRQR
jgi:CRP-like cAMP-binding protein